MKFRDRQGHEWESESGQDRLLKRLYGSKAGRVLIAFLIHPAVSKVAGALLGTSLSCVLINSFVKNNGIDMADYAEVNYHSYNDFFIRKIKPELRPIDATPGHLISPCDAKLSVYEINEQSIFYIKNAWYSLKELTHSQQLSEKFTGGYCLLLRLTVDDYHRYCYIDDGVKSKNYRISGKFHTVNPAAVTCAPVYKENTREFTLMHTQHFGDVVHMEVGAMMVGRISNHHERVQIHRGEEKGYFEFGGSTIILLIEKDRVIIDADLLKNTEQGYETTVKMGERIGQSMETHGGTLMRA